MQFNFAYKVLILRNVVKNLLISIGCVTMLFVSRLYFVNANDVLYHFPFFLIIV